MYLGVAKMEEKRRYPKYSEEKQKQIAELAHLKIKTKVELSKEYDITTNTVAAWEKKYFGGFKKDTELTAQDKEIIRLKKLLKEKEEDIEILKKATAIFSRKTR